MAVVKEYQCAFIFSMVGCPVLQVATGWPVTNGSLVRYLGVLLGWPAREDLIVQPSVGAQNLKRGSLLVISCSLRVLMLPAGSSDR